MKMRLRITLIFAVAGAMSVSGCCLSFSDQAAGTVFHVGDTITTSGTNIAVEQFQYGGGTWTSNGSARVDTQQYSGGSGKDLNARNVNLHFMFDYPLDKITLKFGELGGNNNIKVNDDFRNVQNLISLNGNTVGGAHVAVTATQQGNNWYGDMVIKGDINNFVIGGQELWLDDVCALK